MICTLCQVAGIWAMLLSFSSNFFFSARLLKFVQCWLLFSLIAECCEFILLDLVFAIVKYCWKSSAVGVFLYLILSGLDLYSQIKTRIMVKSSDYCLFCIVHSQIKIWLVNYLWKRAVIIRVIKFITCMMHRKSFTSLLYLVNFNLVHK